jgi:hypothetical protein
MLNHPTSKDLPSVISSPESEDGAEHLSLQDGAQSDLFGQEAHRANLFQQRGTTLAKTMTDISGLSSSISSASAALQQSLESRLRQQLDLDGLTIYKGIWKQKTTPQRRLYCQVAAVHAPHKRERLFFVADSLSQGLQGHGQSGQEPVPQEWQREARHRTQSSFWDSSTTIHCRDGKHRPIPTEPSLFPLVNGLSNRVGILRGAGNAIVPQAAAEIIKAFMETYIKLE